MSLDKSMLDTPSYPIGALIVYSRDGSKMSFPVLTVFNAALSFLLNWEGNFRSLEAQTESSLEKPANMGTSVDEVLAKLNRDPQLVRQFHDAYGHSPDRRHSTRLSAPVSQRNPEGHVKLTVPVDPKIAQHHGRLVKTTGHGCL
jgi:hypothetical protein